MIAHINGLETLARVTRQRIEEKGEWFFTRKIPGESHQYLILDTREGIGRVIKLSILNFPSGVIIQIDPLSDRHFVIEVKESREAAEVVNRIFEEGK